MFCDYSNVLHRGLELDVKIDSCRLSIKVVWPTGNIVVITLCLCIVTLLVVVSTDITLAHFVLTYLDCCSLFVVVYYESAL